MSKSKSKKLTYNMMAAATPAEEAHRVALPWMEGAELSVRRLISFKEMISLVMDVSMAVVNMEEMEYIPEAYDFAFRTCVLHYYAGIEMPKDYDKAYSVLYGTPLYDMVAHEIDFTQLADIESSIDERIKYMRDMQVAVAGNSVQKLVDKLDSVIAEGEEIVDRASSANLSDLLEVAAALKPQQDGATADNVIVMPRQ